METCDQKGKLSIQLVIENPSVFKGLLAHYGGFCNAMSQTTSSSPVPTTEANVKADYYSERAVLKAL